MQNSKGFNLYKKYWEEQASFMDKSPWDKKIVFKITILKALESNLKELEFSNHSFKKENDKLIIRLKVPYNYNDIDDFQLKAIELLGIEEDWLTGVALENSKCTCNASKSNEN